MAAPEQDFLGVGWSFPPTFTRSGYELLMAKDNMDIQESLWVLFSTLLGERIMLPEYGCQIWRMVFQAMNTTLMTQLQDMIAQAIISWEPRITPDTITVASDANVAGMVLITVDYTIRKTNTRSNLVYPFYLNEATIPPATP